MNEYIFTFTFVERVDDLDRIDAFYVKVDDASVAGDNGGSVVHFDREAGSLDEAMRKPCVGCSGGGLAHPFHQRRAGMLIATL